MTKTTNPTLNPKVKIQNPRSKKHTQKKKSKKKKTRSCNQIPKMKSKNQYPKNEIQEQARSKSKHIQQYHPEIDIQNSRSKK